MISFFNPRNSKLYAKYSKEILIAAKAGAPDPNSNLALRRAIDKAKANQVPGDVIKRAIDKAKTSGGEDYEVVTYEGFGPGASTLIIRTLTDNINRTVGMVRAAFNKYGGNLGQTGCVSYLFEEKGVIFVESLDDIPDNSILAFRAHGVVKSIYDEAERRGMKIVDLTCPKVFNIREIVKPYLDDSFIICKFSNKFILFHFPYMLLYFYFLIFPMKLHNY